MAEKPTKGRAVQLMEVAARIRQNNFNYSIAVTDYDLPRVRGTVADADGVRFHYGPTRAEAVNCSLRELVAMRVATASLAEQLAGATYLRKQEVDVRMDFDPTDEVIEQTLRELFPVE